jgi:pantetheine-phosphate adenylyltransferase
VTIAIYPATFDPVTNGHIDVARRAALMFDRLVVGVYDRPLKNLLFSPEERLAMTHQAMAHLPNVTIELYHGLTADFARQHDARVIVRGLRVLSDFEWEIQLAMVNRRLSPDIDTICLMASQDYLFLSSSVVKEIFANGGDVDTMAPPHVVAALEHKFSSLGTEASRRVNIVSLRD